MSYSFRDDIISLLYETSIEEEKEETELGDITNYVTDASPSGFFKRAHPDEAFLDAPAKVTSFVCKRTSEKLTIPL